MMVSRGLRDQTGVQNGRMSQTSITASWAGRRPKSPAKAVRGPAARPHAYDLNFAPLDPFGETIDFAGSDGNLESHPRPFRRDSIDILLGPASEWMLNIVPSEYKEAFDAEIKGCLGR